MKVECTENANGTSSHIESVPSVDEEVAKPVTSSHLAAVPDGGLQAWLCVAGGAACFFCSFGWISCVGMFQDYYEQGPLRDHSSSTIGWIPSVEIFCMLFLSPLMGTYFDNHGPRGLLLLGTFLHFLGLLVASFSTQYYQIILSQGICSGIGASMIFNPAITCTATWFHQRRGLAIGLVAAGSSLGGCCFSIVISQLVPKLGFGWAMRVCAIIILALMSLASLTVTSRLPPCKRPVDLMAMVRPLHEPVFVATTIATFFFYYGMLTPLNFIVSDARKHGMSLSLAQYLVIFTNAGSIFGRTIPGYISDKIGRFNTMIACCTLAGISILALWILASTSAMLIAFSVTFGFASGASVGLTPTLVAQISNLEDIGARTGTVFGVASFAALTGTPIGGALVGSSISNGYVYMKVFTGVFCMIGVLFFALARFRLSGLVLSKKV